MGLHRPLISKFTSFLLLLTLLFGILLPSFTAPQPVHAGYGSWAEVPEDRKPYIKAFFLALREEGIPVGAAAAMTARGGSESEFHPWTSEGIYSDHRWENNKRSPEYDSPPAFGFLQMQDRSPGGRLGKMISKVEDNDGGKGTSDPEVAAKWEAKAAAEEFAESDQFATFTADASGGGFVITSTGISYPIDPKEIGWTEPIDSWEKFKKLEKVDTAVVVWTMSVVRPAGWALAQSYKADIALAQAIAEEYGGLAPDSSSGSDGEEGVSVEGGDDSLPEEWELVGMFKRDYLYYYQNPIELKTAEDLSPSERYALAGLQETNALFSGFNFIAFLRTLVAFVGIWFAIYGVLLIVAYLFDRSNIYFELSLVSVLTGGNLTVLAYDDLDARRMVGAQLTRRVIISFILSFLLISGAVYTSLDWLIDTVKYFIDF